MTPSVSVIVSTYNQEKFIATCLEGILMQRTNFSYEVIIGEDCSTDQTREIVFDYEKKFPDIIRVITSEKNVGSYRNSERIRNASKGKYISFCEGDDYWIDPLKLQKQFDFMEAHPDNSMCFHNAIIIFESKNIPPRYFNQLNKSCSVIVDDIINKPWGVPTASIFLRRDIYLDYPSWAKDVWSGDRLIALWCAYHGTVSYINELMSVYRKHSGGVSAAVGSDLIYQYKNNIFLYQHYDKETNLIYTDLINKRIAFYEKKLKKENVIVKLKKYRIILLLIKFIKFPFKVINRIIRR